MIELLALAFCGLVLWSIWIGLKNLVFAISEPEGRGKHVAKALIGLLFAALITYPLFLGPAVASFACSGTGLAIAERIDMSSTGYEIVWPGENLRLASDASYELHTPEDGLFRNGIEDILARRVAFIETRVSGSDGWGRFSLAPDTSRHCLVVGSFGLESTVPAGYCLSLENVTGQQSRYLLKPSANFHDSRALQKSVELLERGSGRVIASYKVRNIPVAQLSSDMSRRCPANAEWKTSPLYTLAAAAAPEKRPAMGADRLPEGTVRPIPSRCRLPTLPLDLELHRYFSRAGRTATAIRIDNSGVVARENDVYVNRPGSPVVLELSSQDPVVWRIHQTPESSVFAVFVESRTSAAVTGVRANTPLLISTALYSRMAGCSASDYGRSRSRLRSLEFASDVNGDVLDANGAQVIPFYVGDRLRPGGYEEYDGVPESRYVF